MKMMKAIISEILPSSSIVLLCLLILLEGCRTCNAQKIKQDFRLETKLEINFYKKSCPSVEKTVENITWNQVSKNSQLPAKLLRMQFHDCFIRGCDGSVLLDSTEKNTAEKDSIANSALSGFEVIDEIKKELENQCPDVVSCADILALAARDAVSYQFKKPMWDVLLGRKDGRISIASEVLPILPSPFANFSALLDNFQSHGMNLVDLVVLSGGHTIGVTHCNIIGDRLYNFTGNNDTDPAIEPEYVRKLKNICTLPINPATELEMDPKSTSTFDTSYFVSVNQKMGIFQSDAALLDDPVSARLVTQLQNNPGLFFARFAQSMKKLGTIVEVNNSEGEIRKNCRVVNS